MSGSMCSKLQCLDNIPWSMCRYLHLQTDTLVVLRTDGTSESTALVFSLSLERMCAFISESPANCFWCGGHESGLIW